MIIYKCEIRDNITSLKSNVSNRRFSFSLLYFAGRERNDSNKIWKVRGEHTITLHESSYSGSLKRNQIFYSLFVNRAHICY